MTDHITAYPLLWPPTKARTQYPKPSRFATNSWSQNKRISLARAIRDLLREIDLLGGINEIISSNLKLRHDGLPYSSQRVPDDPGIAVYFDLPDTTLKTRPVCMTCDRWDKQACNIWSIAKCVGALRGLERWGGGEMVNAAFTGFLALPNPAAAPWWSVLEFYSEAEAFFQGDFEIKAKKLLQKYHPDNDDEHSDDWMFAKVVKARDEGRRRVAAKAGD